MEWSHPERAHIVSQPVAGMHVRTHLAMLGYGLRHRDLREIAGQMLRLTVAAPGSGTGRYQSATPVALTSALSSRCPYPTIFDSFSKVPPPVVPASRSRHRFKVVGLAAGVQSDERASRPA